MTDDELAAECVRRGYRCVRPGDPRDAYLFEPPDPDVKTAHEQRLLDAMPAFTEAIRQAALLFEALTSHKVVFHDKFHAWLALPAVKESRR